MVNTRSALSYAIILLITAIVLVLTINYFLPNPNQLTCIKYRDYLEESGLEVESSNYQDVEDNQGCLVKYKDGSEELVQMRKVRRAVK